MCWINTNCINSYMHLQWAYKYIYLRVKDSNSDSDAKTQRLKSWDLGLQTQRMTPGFLTRWVGGFCLWYILSQVRIFRSRVIPPSSDFIDNSLKQGNISGTDMTTVRRDSLCWTSAHQVAPPAPDAVGAKEIATMITTVPQVWAATSATASNRY